MSPRLGLIELLFLVALTSRVPRLGVAFSLAGVWSPSGFVTCQKGGLAGCGGAQTSTLGKTH